MRPIEHDVQRPVEDRDAFDELRQRVRLRSRLGGLGIDVDRRAHHFVAEVEGAGLLGDDGDDRGRRALVGAAEVDRGRALAGLGHPERVGPGADGSGRPCRSASRAGRRRFAQRRLRSAAMPAKEAARPLGRVRARPAMFCSPSARVIVKVKGLKAPPWASVEPGVRASGRSRRSSQPSVICIGVSPIGRRAARPGGEFVVGDVGAARGRGCISGARKPDLKIELDFAQRRLRDAFGLEVPHDRVDLAGLLVDFELAGELHVQAEVIGDDPDAEGMAGFGLAQVDRAFQVAFEHRDVEFGRGELGGVGALGGFGVLPKPTCGGASRSPRPSAAPVLIASPGGQVDPHVADLGGFEHFHAFGGGQLDRHVEAGRRGGAVRGRLQLQGSGRRGGCRSR